MGNKTFFDCQYEIFNSFRESNYKNALIQIEDAKTQFPDRIDKTAYWEACVYSVTENVTNAIAALRNAIDNDGIWWNPLVLTNDPDLKNLQDEDAFNEILVICEEKLKSGNMDSDCSLYIYGNETYDKGLFTLHWKGANVEDFAPFWLEDSPYLFGFPQSSQLFGYNSYSWDNIEKANMEVDEMYYEFTSKFDLKSIIIAGASQGGRLIIEQSLDGRFKDSKGFIAVIPSIQTTERFEALLLKNDYSKVKGCIIVGSDDSFFEKTIELQQLFEKYKVDCKFMIVDGLGHFFPENFSELLKEAVDYVEN